MQKQLHIDILPQPDDTTCGPTCLHAVYRYFDDELPLAQVIGETPRLDEGGTFGVSLGCHALRRGYRATIYTYNLRVFDPTWFTTGDSNNGDPGCGDAKSILAERLAAQMAAKKSRKLQVASRAYIEFLRLGGKLRMQDLTGALIRKYLNRSIPVLAGLSATYLYGQPREYGAKFDPDDVRGVAQGHFVVLCGYDKQRRRALVADPYLPNPLGAGHHYEVGMDRLVCAILLGVLTYDANFLVLEPNNGHFSQTSKRELTGVQ